MGKRILYLKLGAVPGMNEKIRTYLQRYADIGTTVDVFTLPSGPRHLEYEYYQALAGAQTLKAIKQAEKDGYDGVIIGCFDDPVLDAAREICDHTCVVGPAEAAMDIAATLGERFSIIVGREKWIPRMRINVDKYGHHGHLASFRSLNLGVLDFQSDTALTQKRLRDEIGLAIEHDNAEVVILGCTMEFGFFSQLQKEFTIPILDAMLCGLKRAEYLIGLKHGMGWYTSKVGKYKGPEPKEVRDWHLPEVFGLGNLWD